MKLSVMVLSAALLSAAGGPGLRAEGEAAPGRLPQKHEYQKTLRAYMASLKEKDFDHGVTAEIDESKPVDPDPDYLYRNYLLTLMQQPLVGTKRGTPAVKAPPASFLLSNIERTNAVYIPPVWPEALMSFVQWDFPGNPYRNSRALKLRAFAGAAVQLMMFHDFAEANDGKSPSPIRPDWHGYNPVFWAAAYPGFKDALPPDVRTAFETGMKMAGERILSWGIRGESCENDLLAPLGLVYISRAVGDPEFARKVEAYAKPLFTDPRYISPAGYWVERGGPETGFGGAANLYASWIGLMTDWPFVQSAIERVYRLRGHLILPEPDGRLAGPSHFNARLGSPSYADQQAWDGVRDAAAAMITDEAAQFVALPDPETLKTAPARRGHMFVEQIRENLRDAKGHYYTDDELTTQNTMWPWTLRMWMTYNFPISQNPAYEFYRKGTFAHRQALEKAGSPLLKSPFLRGESFFRDFNREFVAVRQPAFAAILHSGPVADQRPDDGKAQFGGPMGLGGGQLSAFWTPQAGAVILGLRMGMSYDKSFDVLDAWRTWPMHAVSGVTADGRVFTSARNVAPQVACDAKDGGGRITVEGPLVAMKIVKEPGASDAAKAKDLMYDEPLAASNGYARIFTVDGKGIRVETTVGGDGRETMAELYETIPVYLGKGTTQASNANVRIEFQIGGKWVAASEQSADKVQAVRLTRFGGVVIVSFEQPRRVKLSPAEWTDKWLNEGASARNIMIDLLESGDKPVALKAARTLAYRIEPALK